MNEILFFYLKTGGGHYAPVSAIAGDLSKSFPGRAVPILLDGMADAHGFPRFVIEDGYRITQARAKWIYETAYALTKIPPFALANSALVAGVLFSKIEQQILTRRAHAIVVSHFFLIAPVQDILRKHRMNTPVITLVTDPYTAHPLWFLRKNQTMVVFSERVKATAVRSGIPAERVHVFPFILNSTFSRENLTARAGRTRTALGFRADQKVILLLGGGDGMPRGFRITKELLRTLPGTGIILVCGRNKSLFRRARRLLEADRAEDLRVFAYVDNVPELIGASDAVLTKGGASTLMEILALGKTPVITTYIWEQEKGNVEFVVNGCRGVYETRIRRLPEILRGIFDDAPSFRLIRETNARTPILNGTRQVAEFILNEADRRRD